MKTAVVIKQKKIPNLPDKISSVCTERRPGQGTLTPVDELSAPLIIMERGAGFFQGKHDHACVLMY